jgi:hypothetical protein
MVLQWLWQYEPMIAEGTHPSVQIDHGKDEPGMTLHREYGEGGYLVWRDYLKDSEPVTAPVDIETLPVGKYCLV